MTANISIHALREEGDLITGGANFPVAKFLSTPSARRATIDRALIYDYKPFLSTPSARRATIDRALIYDYKPFLSTPSARRATLNSWARNARNWISIHALREEGDHYV